jgi:hypothetical protein
VYALGRIYILCTNRHSVKTENLLTIFYLDRKCSAHPILMIVLELLMRNVDEAGRVSNPFADSRGLLVIVISKLLEHQSTVVDSIETNWK